MRFALFLLPALAIAAPVAELVTTSTPPPAGTVLIDSVAYGGTGCPQGTVASIISADHTTLTLIFDQFVTSIGTGVPITDNRMNCQLAVDITYPSGFQYSILSANYRGYAELDAGVNATQASTYYFSGQTAQSTTSTTFVGPVTGDYLIADTAASASVVFSPCGAEGVLNINSQIAMVWNKAKYPASQGLMTDDSVDLKFTQILYLQWQTCTK